MAKHGMRIILASAVAGLVVFGAVLGYHRRADIADAMRSEPDRLEVWLFDVDYARGVVQARRRPVAQWAEQSPKTSALLAAHEALAGNQVRARQFADAIAKAHPGDPWGDFARAAALIYVRTAEVQAIDAARRAARAMPGEIAATWLLAETLRLRHRYDVADGVLEAADPKRSNGLLQAERAAIRFEVARSHGGDPTEVARAIALFNAAAALPDHRARSLYLLGWHLKSNGRTREALAVLRDAAAISRSGTIHRAYWSALIEEPNLSDADKLGAFAADENSLWSQGSVTPDLIFAAAGGYASLGRSDIAAQRDAALHRDFPDSEEVARADLNAIRTRLAGSAALSRGGRLSLQDRSRLRALGENPRYWDSEIAGMAYGAWLEALVEDPTVSRDEVFHAVRGTMAHGLRSQYSLWRAAQVLLARKLFADAARLSAFGIARIKALAAEADGIGDQDRPSYEKAYLAALHASNGWAIANMGDPRAGAEKLKAAYAIDPGQVDTLRLLGETYALLRDYASAENWFLRCLATPTERSNPCAGSLRGLFTLRGGNAADFDSYMVSVAPRLAAYQRERIGRDSGGDPMTTAPLAFALRGLDGRTYDSRHYRGRPIVLVLWALWCDICRIELPKLDALWRDPKFASRNAVLTINDGSDPKSTREWAMRRGIALPILDGKAFLAQAGVRAVPTIWILDANGRRRFAIEGMPPDLEGEIRKRLAILTGEPLPHGGAPAAR